MIKERLKQRYLSTRGCGETEEVWDPHAKATRNRQLTRLRQAPFILIPLAPTILFHPFTPLNMPQLAEQ